MKRILLKLVLVLVVFSFIGDAQPWRRSGRAARRPHATGTISAPCSPTIHKIEDCPDQGCGGNFDPNLNLRKNIRADNQAPINKDLQDLASLPDPVPDFAIGDTREKLTALGEGRMIRVVAVALKARDGNPESCNCGLTAPRDTDNHIVLVDPAIGNPTLAKNEKKDSQTAEFTPRVRLDHAKLAGRRLQKLIKGQSGKLLVRVTGLQMFDSEHSLGPFPLKRHNNWEIHPVLGLEFCPKSKTCTADSDANWKNLEDQ